MSFPWVKEPPDKKCLILLRKVLKTFPNISRTFRALFLGNGDGNSKKKLTKVFWRAGKVNKYTPPWKPCSFSWSETPMASTLSGPMMKIYFPGFPRMVYTIVFFCSVTLGRTPRGSCNRTLLRRVLRRFFTSRCFLEGFLEGTYRGF